MQSGKLVGTLAIVIALLPYAGIPGAWYRPVIFGLALFVAFLAFRSMFVAAAIVHERTMPLPFEQSAEVQQATHRTHE